MALFTWNDQFSVGIESVDTQHKKLIDLVNQLHDAMMGGSAKEEMGKILAGLIDYTAIHFIHEENMFMKYDWPERNDHKEHHKKLVDEVKDFQSKFESGEVTVSSDLLNFLKDWLMNHIMKEDKKYSSFLIEKGAK